MSISKTDCESSSFLLSGYVFLPFSADSRNKWLKIFDRWSLSSIVSNYYDKMHLMRCQLQDLGEKYWKNVESSLEKKLIECDLNGGAVKSRNDEVSRFIDIPYDLKAMNLKAASSDPDRFPSFLVSLSKYALPRYENGKDIAAQATLIFSSKSAAKPEWLHINMSSYDFWNDVADGIGRRYNSINLGGWLFKIGEDDIIDIKFKAIIEDT